MKFTVQSIKPRNPLGRCGHAPRRGLSSRMGERTRRQRQDRALRRDLLEMKRIP